MKIIFSALLSLTFTFAVGQQIKDTLQIKQVEVVKNFEANIATFTKVEIKPQALINERKLPVYKYQISNHPIPVSDPIPVIKPLAMDPDPPFKVNNGYIDASYGHIKNLNIQAGYNVIQKDDYDAGIQAHYLSLDNSSQVPLQKFRTMGLGLYGQKLVRDNIQVFGNIESDFEKRYFYHTSLNLDSTAEDNGFRNINSINVSAGIRNPEETKTGFNYQCQALIGKQSLATENTNEWNFNVSASLNRKFGEMFKIKTEAQIEHSILKAEKDLSQLIVDIRTGAILNFGKLTSEIGVQYLSAGYNKHLFYPNISFQFPLKAPYLLITGKIQQGNYLNNLRNTIRLNPFIESTFDSLTNTITRDFSIGVKGLAYKFSYQLRGGAQLLKNQMFFLNNVSDIRKFTMHFDDGILWYLNLILSRKINEQFNIGGRIGINHYSLDNFAHAWFVPRIEGSVYMESNFFKEKLRLRGDFLFNSSTYYTDRESNILKTNAMTDLGITVTYNLAEKLSIYSKAMNILNNKYERWFGYPTIGFNAVFGVKLLF